MSEIENLESLSNADLRKMCIQHGLPNVPITDSSRNLLLKKLRATLSGSPASQPKKTQRRETIHVTKTTEKSDLKEEVKVEPERRTPSRGAGRRTIAGTPTLELQKASEKQASETITAAPIGTRRRSTRDQEIAPSQKDQKPTKTFNPVVILESDDEDNDLLLAAEQAEQRAKPLPVAEEEKNARSRSSRSVSLSKTGVVNTSYSQRSDKPLAAVPEVSSRNLQSESLPRGIFKPQINTNIGRYSLHTNLMPKSSTVVYNEMPTISRYSTNSLASGLYTSKATKLYNEQSDENEDINEQDYETPFLSNFARNLERLKSDTLVLGNASALGTTDFGGDYASPRPLQRSKRNYEITGRRPTKDSVTESLRQLLIALDRKYNLRLYLVLATMFLVLAFLYVIVYQ